MVCQKVGPLRGEVETIRRKIRVCPITPPRLSASGPDFTTTETPWEIYSCWNSRGANSKLFAVSREEDRWFRFSTVILADYLNSVFCCSVQRPFFNFQIEFSRGDIQSVPDNVINRLGGDSTCWNKSKTWNKILLCRALFQRESILKIYRVYLNLANYRLGTSK